MLNAKIDMSDLIQKINSLTDADFVRDVAQAVANEAVEPELAKEPFRTTRPKAIFVSSKQRAFVMAGIKSGDIQVPYQRTGNIGIVQKTNTTNGVDVTVPAPYSDLVRTAGKQARIHQGVWDTTEDIAQRLEADVVEVIATAHVIAALDKAGLT